MKRDMNLIRKLAFIVEASPHWAVTDATEIEGVSREDMAYQLELMSDADLVNSDTSGRTRGNQTAIRIQRLTWAGHDFLDAARNEAVWNSVTKHVQDTVVSVTFDGLKSLLKQAGQQVVKHGVEWIKKTDWQWVHHLPM